jgi:SAM-dependent methyltransferase
MTAEAPACPVCGSRETGVIESFHDAVGREDYEVLACRSCALVFSRPMKFPGSSWYESYNYVCGYVETASAASMGRFPYFLDSLPQPPRGRLLDIGCASGQFLQMAAARGYDVEGIEVDSRFVAMARTAGLSVRHGVLDEADARAHAGAYDVVAAMEVLEHVADPVGFLRLIGSTLKPGGWLLVSVPDNRRPTPFGRDLWDYPPHHLTRWNPGALRLALERAGYAVVGQRSMPLMVREYSRIWADRSAQLLLKGIKRLLFGAGAAGRPMDDLLAGEAPKPAAAGALPDKIARVRLVALYHDFFHTVTWPLFFLMLAYYRLTRPGVGLGLWAVARKTEAA